MRPRLAYETRYGYQPVDALRAEFWWRVEHVGYYRGGNGGLFGRVRSFGYRRRKAAEHRAYPLRALRSSAHHWPTSVLAQELEVQKLRNARAAFIASHRDYGPQIIEPPDVP